MTTPSFAEVDGTRIAHETHGDPDDPTLLMIMGLGSSRVSWNPDFITAAVERGFFVVTFDNRDVGDSTWVDTEYRLEDMADDTAGLIDHLGRGPVHVLGISMGGMIAQTLAIHHPRTVLSLTSIMSTTGAPDVGRPAPELMPLLTDPRPAEREASIEHGISVMKATWSPDHWDLDEARARAVREVDLGLNPVASEQQLRAILASGSRAEDLAAIRIPTLVVHGRQDRLVDPSGGVATADAVPDAELMLIDDMAHDLPRAHHGRILDAVAALADRT